MYLVYGSPLGEVKHLHRCVDSKEALDLCQSQGFIAEGIFNTISEFEIIDNKLKPKVVTMPIVQK